MNARALHEPQALEVLLRIEQLLQRLEAHLSAAPPARKLSDKPSARRMRKLRGHGEFARHPGDAKRAVSPLNSPHHLASPQVTPPVAVKAFASSSASSSSENCKKTKSYAPGAHIPKLVFRALYSHMAAAKLRATGKAWYAEGSVPGQETAFATRLLHKTRSLEAARAAIDRFAQLWRDHAWTRQHWEFGFVRVFKSLEQIHVKRGRLILVTPASAPLRPPRAAAQEPAPAPPPMVRRIAPTGMASVGAMLEQLRGRGVLPSR